MNHRSQAAAIAGSLIAILALLSSDNIAAASVNRTHQYAAVPAKTAPHFDSGLSDPVWKGAVTASQFEDLTTRRPAPFETTAYVLYDGNNLYVAFRADQPGAPIHADQSTNNVGFGQDDAVGVCVDTSNAGQQVYCFEATPRGVRYQQASETNRYAPPWEAKAAIDGTSWSAMFTIPLRDLRAAGGGARTWRFNFIRICAATGDHYTWAYDPLMQDAQPPNWPLFTDARWWPALTDLQIAASAARPQPRLELYGLESLGGDRSVFQQATNQFTTEAVRHAGLDFTYPVSSTIAAVGTLDPDFSNVEVDQQTIVPQEFARNLTEYRPFFAQGAQYFTPEQTMPAGGFVNAPDQVFYSPSIGTFERGFKVEGTYGMQAIGALEIRGIGIAGQPIDDTAFGLKHQLSDRTFLYWINGVAAHHASTNDSTIESGNDSTIDSGLAGRNLKTGFVWGYNQALEERRLSFDPARTFAYERHYFIDVHKPNYELLQSYQHMSPGYGPLDGFTTIDDANGPIYMANFTGTTPGLKSWTGFFTGDRFLTHDGRVHEADFFGNQDVVTTKLVHLNVAVGDSELNDPLLTGGVTLPFNQATLSGGYRDGTPAPVDAFFGAGKFATFYLQQFNASTTRPIGSRLNLQATLAGTHERSDAIGVDGQILRSIAIGESLGPDTNVTLAFRSISGNGGFALPGKNLAAAFHSRFASGSELFVSFGTPAAPTTLNRFILKYLWRIGGGAGT